MLNKKFNPQLLGFVRDNHWNTDAPFVKNYEGCSLIIYLRNGSWVLNNDPYYTIPATCTFSGFIRRWSTLQRGKTLSPALLRFNAEIRKLKVNRIV